jgi:zinc protease
MRYPLFRIKKTPLLVLLISWLALFEVALAHPDQSGTTHMHHQRTADWDKPKNIYEYRLANGLRVIFKQDQRSPVIVHMVWYRAGGLDEFNGTTGVAHVLEHMMFKGTKKIKAGEFSRRIAALGGLENAFTSKDFTAYFQQIDKQHLSSVMQLEADRMANLVLTAKEFQPEIKVIMEERRLRTDDQPQALLSEQLLATAFTASPQRVPVIGWMNDLQTMTHIDARAWYQRWYAPNNAIVVIAGDAQPEEVHRLAQKYYGALPARTLPTRKPQQEPTQRGMRTVELKAPAENPLLIMAYKVPVLRDLEHDQDPYALIALEAILNGYANSRLPRHLMREQRIADDVDTGYLPIARGPQLFYLSGVPAKDKSVAELEASLRKQINKIITEGLQESELKRVKAQLIANRVFKRDTLFSQVMEMGILEMSGFSWRDIDHILEKIATVTPEQVQAVAQKYFQDDALTIARLVPLPMPANRHSTDKTPLTTDPLDNHSSSAD